MIFMNKSPWLRRYVILYGVAEVVDGLIRIATIGFLSSSLVNVVARGAVRNHISRLKKSRNHEQAYFEQYGDGG